MPLDTLPDARWAVAQPVTIGRVAGWLHAGSGHGVLLCGAQGFEALSSHLGWHILADLLAARGLTVLRFDYAGDGDSLDPPADLSFTDAAIADTQAAAMWMRETLGIRQLSCVGLRFGALIAAAAFSEGESLDRLALLAPPTSGRAYVRQMRIAAKLFADVRGYPPETEGLIDLCGYRTSPEDAARMAGLKLSLPPAQATLVLDPPDGAPTDPGESTTGPAALTHGVFDGYVEFMRDPSHSATPFATFERVADWIANAEPQARLAAIPHSGRLESEHFEEERVVFGRNSHLAGVLCRPRGVTAEVPVVLMLNAGANGHEGWARSAVDHARALAAEGIASLRMDLGGLGDSAWTQNGPRPWLYSPDHIDDAIAAVDYLASIGLENPHVAGLCAGGYIAFHAGARDKRIKSVIAANVLRLIWTDKDNLDAYERNNIQTAAAYGDQFRNGRALKRIFNGEVSPLRLLEVAGKLAAKSLGRLSHRLGLPLGDRAEVRTVRNSLVAITGRGARIAFVHSDRDQSIPEAERHFGPDFSFARKQTGTVFKTIPGADHELTPRAARDCYLDIIRQQVKDA